jgi:hypothetical protein
MKSGKFIYLALVLILLLTACGSNSPAPTAAPATEKPVEVAASPTIAPTDAPTEEPTAAPTEEPTAEPTEEPTATLEADTPTPEPAVNARFVPAMPGNNFYLDSDTADASWKANMEGLARNQAIPKPFEWQLVGVPDATKWSDVFPYFKDYLLDKGWTVTADGGNWQTLANGNSMYVGGFIKTVDGKKEKISVLFYPKSKQYDGHYRVFYSERK